MPQVVTTKVNATPGTGGPPTGKGTRRMVETINGNLYVFLANASYTTSYVKSTDRGISWSAPVTIKVGTNDHQLSVWYDRWSGISGGLIHLAYITTAANDIFYRTVDTENADALSTETVIFAGASVASGGSLSITRTVGGNVLCRGVIDAGAEGGFFKLLNADVPNGAWASATVNEAIATTDAGILLPGFAADTNDAILVFWDNSATEISRVNYDDSADTWAETSIATSMTQGTTSWPPFAAVVDLANSQHILVAWSAFDTLNADLKCWTITDSSITAKTDVITNSTDDQGMVALDLNLVTGRWTAYYFGKTDGSETYATAASICYRHSDDTGTTWSSEAVLSGVMGVNLLESAGRTNFGHAKLLYNSLDTAMQYYIQSYAQPRAQVLLGV